MGLIKDIKGKKFNKLTVVNFAGKDKNHRGLWNCICDCGNVIISQSKPLLNGKKKSCGCAYKDAAARKKLPSHRIKILKKWSAMISRCENIKNVSYLHYGGRGIKVCIEWKVASIFIDWAYNNGYEEHRSIERINNNGNYEPDNCKWATNLEQAYNTSRTVKCNIKGEILTSKEVFEKYGIPAKLIYARVKAGFVGEDLIKPIRSNGKTHRAKTTNRCKK